MKGIVEDSQDIVDLAKDKMVSSKQATAFVVNHRIVIKATVRHTLVTFVWDHTLFTILFLPKV